MESKLCERNAATSFAVTSDAWTKISSEGLHGAEAGIGAIQHDRPDLSAVLVHHQIMFASGMLAVYFRLFLYRWGIARSM
jgi:hypothetical protein